MPHIPDDPDTDELLRVLVFGAGAIGTYIGGSLALSGHSVVFMERPEVAYQLEKRGLHLKISDQDAHIPSPQITASIETALKISSFDVAIFALKSYDTLSALESLRPHRGSLPPFLCLQNGVDNETAIESVLGSTKVIAGTVTSAIGRNAAGDIVVERLRGIGIGATHALSPVLAKAFTEAGLNARLYPRVADMKWSKLLTNLIANATSAILDMTPSMIFAQPDLYHLEIRQLREALSVMSAYRIHPVDLPATPTRLLAFCVRSLPLWLSRPLLRRAVGGGRGGKMPSLHIDLHSGRGKSEVDYLNGAVVRHGEKINVPTPVNRLLNDTLQALIRGELHRDAFANQPNKLLKQMIN